MTTNNPLHPASARQIGLGERSQAHRPAGLLHRELEDLLLHLGIAGVLRLVANTTRQAQHECSATDRAKPLALQARAIAELADTIDALDAL